MGLWFKASDASKLYDLASRHYPENPEDASWFAKAARCAEKGTRALLECGTGAQVEECVHFFVLHGIEPPEIEEVRF